MKWLRLGSRRVGRIDAATKSFYTERSADRHYVGKHEGYGVSRDVIKHLQATGIETIVLTIDSPSTGPYTGTYKVPLYVWTKHGKVDKLSDTDDWQVFLTWKRIQGYTPVDVLDTINTQQKLE